MREIKKAGNQEIEPSCRMRNCFIFLAIFHNRHFRGFPVVFFLFQFIRHFLKNKALNYSINIWYLLASILHKIALHWNYFSLHCLFYFYFFYGYPSGFQYLVPTTFISVISLEILHSLCTLVIFLQKKNIKIFYKIKVEFERLMLFSISHSNKIFK